MEDFLFVTMVYFSSVSEEFKTKYYNSMNYEPKNLNRDPAPEERHVNSKTHPQSTQNAG
jgi:hypothetical protein